MTILVDDAVISKVGVLSTEIRFAGLRTRFGVVLCHLHESGVFVFSEIPPISVKGRNRHKTNPEFNSETSKLTFRVKGYNFSHLVDLIQDDHWVVTRDVKTGSNEARAQM